MNQQNTKKIIDIAIKEFAGDFTTLESAIGAFLVGQKLGWKVLYLVHDRRTLKKFEAILKMRNLLTLAIIPYEKNSEKFAS